MPNDPGGSSYDYTSPSSPWKRLSELMQFIQNIYSTLDDATQHSTFNEGTMRSFVYQLDQVKRAIAVCAPPGYVSVMTECLRLACDHLNRAADEYERRRRRTDIFYRKKNSALEKLDELLTIWDKIRNDG